MKGFLMRKMLEAKMKDVPAEDREKIFTMIEKNPDFFQKIASEVKAEIDSGKDQMEATMVVMQKYQDELKGMME